MLKKNRKFKIAGLSTVCFITIVAVVVFATRKPAAPEQGQEVQTPPPPVIDIFNGNDRPVAFMFDNNINAVPQAGLNDAYLVYEIIVEGGETRLMALFKNKPTLNKVGPLRSSRHYFLDYALENDAIYVHYGWSPQAQADIKKLKVQNVHGISEGAPDFWRVSDRFSPHNVVTAMPNILKLAQNKKYNVLSEQKSVLNYVPVKEEITFTQETQGVKVANKVTLPYSYSNTVKYIYDPATKKYVRYTRGVKQTDWRTQKTVSTKNIIVTFAQNYALNDGSGKDRQGLKNIGVMKGYYLTNGMAIPITCEKAARNTQTVYKDLQGNEIKVNDGNTFIQIVPKDSKVKIEK